MVEPFAVLSWHADDIEKSENDSGYVDKIYKIFAFGATEGGESVCLQIDNFCPFFYVKVPDSFSAIKDLEQAIKDRLRGGKHHFLDSRIVKRKDIYGFTNCKEFKFVRLRFDQLSAYKQIIYWFKDHNKGKKKIEGISGYRGSFELYNANIDPMLCFTTVQKILLSGWIDSSGLKINDEPVSRAKFNYKADWQKVKPLEKHTIAPFKIASFDIECFSSNPKQMPDHQNSKDAIIQIGTSIQKGETITKHVVVLGDCDPVEGVMIVTAKTEKELLEKWVEFIQEADPDILIGYNIDDFDWTYIWERAQMHEVDVSGLSRLDIVPSEFKKDTMESKAYGVNIFNYIKTPGIVQIDLLHWFRKEVKMESYKLDAVASRFLGENKRDVSPQQIFSMAGPSGNAKSRAVVADYCAQDTLLPIKLVNKMAMLPNLIEMSKVTRVPIYWLLSRGQQIKVFSQIFYEAWYHQFLIPADIPVSKFKYQGAHVFDPMRGAYFKPISGLDFASLYPSIMIAHNLCPTTWVRDPVYDGLPGVDYKHVKWDTEDGSGDYKFVQNTPGLVPNILDTLWKERKKVKKQMATAKGMDKLVLNGKQLAIKVSMNSIYGFFGVSVGGMLPCVPIASSVTYIGREMIEHSKKCAEEWYDGSEKCNGVKAIVRYGDSVAKDTPIMVRKDANCFVDEVQNLGSLWKEYHRIDSDGTITYREESRPENLEVLTEKGYQKVLRVVRHRSGKKMYRVMSNYGTVVVTEDHSLLNDKGEILKPKNIPKDTVLMHV